MNLIDEINAIPQSSTALPEPSQPVQSNLTPEAFKQMILAKHPNGIASDGMSYAQMDAMDLTQKIVSKYPNGVTNDGHKYSDYLAAPTAQSNDNGGLFGTIFNGAKTVGQAILNPAVSLGTHLGQATAGATANIAGAIGDTDLQNKINTRYNALPSTQNTALGGDVSKLQPGLTGAEQLTGDVVQNAAFAIPGEGVLGAIGSGVALGAGSAASQGQDLPTIATSGLLGGALGGTTAGATKLAGITAEKFGNALSGETASKAVQGIKEAYSSALNLNASERAFENRSGKDLAQVLTENQVPLSRNADGTLDASKAIPILKAKLAPLDAEAASVLAGSNKTVNLLDAATAAKEDITSKATTALDRQAASKEIDQYMQAEIQERTQKLAQDTYGSPFASLNKQQQAKISFDAINPTLQEADKIKQGYWGATFDKNRSNLQNHIPYQLGASVKNSIEEALPNSEIGQINKERGDLIDASRRLQKMDGVKLLKGGRLGNIATGVIGSLAGAASGLGPLGVIGGDYFGSKAGEFLQDPATKIAIAKAKANVASRTTGILGKTTKPIGNAISKTGSAVKSSARGVGLLSNILAK